MPDTGFHVPPTQLLIDLAARISQAHTYFHQKVIAARQAIYNTGKTLKSVTVECLLKEKSLVPTIVSVSNL